MVSAVIVTRGDVLLGEIIDSITASGIEDIVIWDNSVRDNLAVYGRYAAIEYATGDLILVQDDDVVLPPESIQALIDSWTKLAEDGVTDVIVANQPTAFRHSFYSDHCLVGFGAVFHRDLPKQAFERFNAGITIPGVCPPHWSGLGMFDVVNFRRTCDVVFTALTPRVLVDCEYLNLPWAEDETRMYRSAGHQEERARMLDLVRKVRDA